MATEQGRGPIYNPNYGRKLTDLAEVLTGPSLDAQMYTVENGVSLRTSVGALLALPLFRAAYFYLSREDAATGVNYLLPATMAIFTLEGDRLVVRMRNAVDDDPLTGDGWGVVYRSVSSAEVAAISDLVQQAIDAAAAAEQAALLASSVLPYGSRSIAESASVPEQVQRISVMTEAGSLAYVSDPQGTALTTADGRTWSPDGDATEAHWGWPADGSDQTALATRMFDWTTARGADVVFSDGVWAFSSYTYSGRARVSWRGKAGAKPVLRSTAPFGTGDFIHFTGTSRGNGYVLSTMTAGQTIVQLPENIVAAIRPNVDQLRFQSFRVIEMESRGQARYGFTAICTRKIDATTVELDVAVPVTMLVAPFEVGTITAVGSNSFTVAGFIGRNVSDMRYRVVFDTVNGASSTNSAYPVAFNPDTGMFTLERDFPTGLRVGDTISVDRRVGVFVAEPVTGSIEGLRIDRPIKLDATPGQSGDTGLRLTYSNHFVLKNLVMQGFTEACISQNFSHKSVSTDLDLSYANRSYLRPGTTTDYSDGTGYGIGVNNSYGPYVARVTGFSCRRTLDFGGAQCTTWNAVSEDIVGIGGGTSFTGLSYWPNGPVISSVVGSHGNAFGTVYRNTFCIGTNIGVNCRGKSEQILGVYGCGMMGTLINSFAGDPPKVDGAYYTTERPGWLPQTSKYSMSTQDGYLNAIWSITNTSISDSVISLSNVDVRGVNIAGISASNGGRYSVVRFHNIYIETGAYDGTTFDLLRRGGNGNLEITRMLDFGRPTIVNKADNPNTSISLLARASVIQLDTCYCKWPDGSIRMYIPDDATMDIPIMRTGLGILSVHCAAPSRAQYCSGVQITASGRQYTMGFANSMDFLGVPLTGTTGTDGNINVSYMPAGGGNVLTVENRTGSRQLVVVSFSESSL